MWKYFYAKGTYNWTNALDQLVSNYNGTKHSTILMKPKDVNKELEREPGMDHIVWTPFCRESTTKFKVDLLMYASHQ